MNQRYIVSLDELRRREKAGERPEGYAARFEQVALRRNGDDLVLDQDDYEAIRGFYQSGVEPGPAPKPPPLDPAKPGDKMAILIYEWSGIKYTITCTCNSFRQKMNEWGWDGSWQHRCEVWAYLVHQGKSHEINVAAMTWTHRRDIIDIFKKHLPDVTRVDVIRFLASVCCKRLGAKDGQ